MSVVKVTSLLVKAGSGLGFSCGVRACKEMEIQCVKGKYMLNQSQVFKKNSRFESLLN